MLEYEESRTEELVRRLMTTGKIIRSVITLAFALIFVILFSLLGMAFSKETAIALALLGGAAGYIIGRSIAALITVMIEWHAQMLVGVENALIFLKKK
jgi:lipoprotein signal peptidase